MGLDLPEVGQVIRYSYLWHREHMRGHEEGNKARPCAVVLASTKNNRVIVAPITHSYPQKGTFALEIPQDVKNRIGLDAAKSWIIVDEVNVFTWPGYDIRFLPESEPKTVIYGRLTPGITKVVIDAINDQIENKNVKSVNRDF